MYLEHFGIDKLPFGLTPNTHFFCSLPGHQDAYNVLRFALDSGEGFIKIVGEVGTGKTLLCRKLLNSLGDKYVTAYIPNPDLGANELRRALANELGVTDADTLNSSKLLQAISEQLMQYRREGKQVVVVVDEAQALPDESLEALRLLTNLETESEKLLQIVLFAQPELDQKLERHHLRQLKQRITFSHHLKPISRQELQEYLCHRLATAGHTKGSLFTGEANDVLYRASGGVPRVINILCHKALLVAFGKGEHKVSAHAMIQAVKDSGNVVFQTDSLPTRGGGAAHKRRLLLVVTGLLCVAAVAAYYLINVRHLL